MYIRIYIYIYIYICVCVCLCVCLHTHIYIYIYIYIYIHLRAHIDASHAVVLAIALRNSWLIYMLKLPNSCWLICVRLLFCNRHNIHWPQFVCHRAHYCSFSLSLSLSLILFLSWDSCWLICMSVSKVFISNASLSASGICLIGLVERLFFPPCAFTNSLHNWFLNLCLVLVCRFSQLCPHCILRCKCYEQRDVLSCTF